MTTIMAFIKRHPVLTFYALVFVISWGGFLIAVGSSGLSVYPLPAAAIFSMVAGPVVAGLVCTGLVYGRSGFRDFRLRLFTWRANPGSYAVALLSAPVVISAVLFVLSLASPAFLPGIVTTSQKAGHVIAGIAVGLAAGVFEEIGWTGFAVPTLRRRYSVLATGLIMGPLWGAWHFLGNVAAAGTTSGTLSQSIFVPLILIDLLIGWMVPFRVLMVWVYDRTKSVLVAMLMHVTLTASIRIFSPLEISGTSLFIYDFVLTAALWLVVAAVAVANRGQLWQLTPRRAIAAH